MTHTIARHRYPADDRRHYLQFLESCIAECDRLHTPEEVAQAADFLRMDSHPAQSQLTLIGEAA